MVKQEVERPTLWLEFRDLSPKTYFIFSKLIPAISLESWKLVFRSLRSTEVDVRFEVVTIAL